MSTAEVVNLSVKWIAVETDFSPRCTASLMLTVHHSHHHHWGHSHEECPSFQPTYFRCKHGRERVYGWVLISGEALLIFQKSMGCVLFNKPNSANVCWNDTLWFPVGWASQHDTMVLIASREHFVHHHCTHVPQALSKQRSFITAMWVSHLPQDSCSCSLRHQTGFFF